MIKIGVVIPVFNRPRLVLAALGSVLAQTRAADEVVVVDDGSTDATVETIARLIAAHPDRRLTLLRQPRSGVAAARNLGLARLSGAVDAIAFLDSDDAWPEDFLARTAAVLAHDLTAIAVSTDRALHSVDDAASDITSCAELAASPWRFFILKGGGVASCTLFRRSALRPGEGFPERFPTGQDTVLFARLAQRGAWRHAAGAPVTFARDFARTHAGDEGHLHKRRSDYFWHWARASEICVALAPRTLRSEPAIAAKMRERWALARGQALTHHRYGSALLCLLRELRHARRLRAARRPTLERTA